jgi:hypothetical protein
MNRTGDPSVEMLLARIAALEAENRQLTERVVKLEEELALARLHRFAPRSESTSIVSSMKPSRPPTRMAPAAKSAMSSNSRTQVCHPSKARRGRSAAADRCRQTCRASASSMIYPTIRRHVLAVVAGCIAWVRP